MRKWIIAVLAVALCCSCEPYKDLKITSVKIESLNPTSLRSMDAVLVVEIYNPSYSFTLQDLQGVLKIDGVSVAQLSCPQVQVKANRLEKYKVEASGAICQGAGLSALGALLSGTSDIKADASGTIRGPLGIKRAFDYKDIDI